MWLDIISRIDFLEIDALEMTALLLGSYWSVRLLEVKKESCRCCFGERPLIISSPFASDVEHKYDEGCILS